MVAPGQQVKRTAEECLDQKKPGRGDKTPIELFVEGVRGWEAGLRHRMSDGK